MQNLSEFRSGPDYDAQYGASYNPEINFLTALAREQKTKILDVCCGTGIITIPLAEAGFEICGIDISPEMLAHANKKAMHLNNATFLLSNALDFSLRKKFNLAIMTGNAFQAFLDEHEILKVLQNINKHLDKDGLFVYGTRLLEGYDISLDDDFELWEEYKDASGKLVRFIGKKSRFDLKRNILYFDMKRRHSDGKEVYSAIEIKFLPYNDMLSLMERAGFELDDQFSDWSMNPFDSKGSNGVFKLKKV